MNGYLTPTLDLTSSIDGGTAVGPVRRPPSLILSRPRRLILRSLCAASSGLSDRLSAWVLGRDTGGGKGSGNLNSLSLDAARLSAEVWGVPDLDVRFLECTHT